MIVSVGLASSAIASPVLSPLSIAVQARSALVATDLIGVRFGPNGDKTRIVFDIIGTPDFTLSGDDTGSGRLFLDFQKMQTGPEGINGFAGKGHIGQYHYGPSLNNATRFVFEFKRTARIKEIFVLEPKGAIKKHRLVVDLETASKAAFLKSLPKIALKPQTIAANPNSSVELIYTNRSYPDSSNSPNPSNSIVGETVSSNNGPPQAARPKGNSASQRLRAPSLKPIARLDVETSNLSQTGEAKTNKTQSDRVIDGNSKPIATPPKDVADILRAEAIEGSNNSDKSSNSSHSGPPLNNQRRVQNSDQNDFKNPSKGIKPRAKITIVIDAGHGGRDPGAVGKYDKVKKAAIYESHVNLAAAKSLSQILAKRGHYNVVLTRKDDTKVELERRSEIARDKNADLFISLHADGNNNKELRGSSVYTLSEKGSKRSILEAQAQDSYEVYNVDIAAVSPDLEATLFGVAQSYTQTENAKFANILLEKLAKVVPLVKNAQRSEDLKVLLRPDVPAVLLEMAFISNEQDEKNLKSAKWRNRTMTAVADAIDSYFEEKGRIEQVIVRETN